MAGALAAAYTMSLAAEVTVISTFTIALALTPLGPCLTPVNEFTTYCCLALQEWIRVRQVNTEWSPTNLLTIEIPNC